MLMYVICCTIFIVTLGSITNSKEPEPDPETESVKIESEARCSPTNLQDQIYLL